MLLKFQFDGLAIRRTLINVATLALTALLSSCSEDPTNEMKFKADIADQGAGRVELIATITNFSAATQTLSEIDVDVALHKALQLTTINGLSPQFIPFDNTMSYTINRIMRPGETFSLHLYGNKIGYFMTGDVDFVVNNDNFNFRSIPVSCCVE